MNNKGGRDRYKRKESGISEAKSDSGRSRDAKNAPYIGRFRRGVGDRTPPRFRIYEEPRTDEERYGHGEYVKEDRSGEGRRSDRPGGCRFLMFSQNQNALYVEFRNLTDCIHFYTFIFLKNSCFLSLILFLSFFCTCPYKSPV